MSVKVKCTECGKVLAVPDTARGKAVKCPQCQTKIAVPAEGGEEAVRAEATSAKASKTKTKKASKMLDSEESLLAFDMSRAEDASARVCPKCGFDMKYQDEEDTECGKCGYDTAIGGMGAKARKKSMKGPDPSDFYPGLFSDGLKFVGKNKMLAIRTIGYTSACLLISELFAFLFLWISMVPTRIFLGMCFLIAFMVIPGWTWVFDTEVIKLTLERKDKFKKLGFDFFLCSAMGGAFAALCVAVVIPLGFPFFLLGYLLEKYAGAPAYVKTIFIAIGFLPGLWALPVCMAHMAMPIQVKGWTFWNVARISFKHAKPLSFCLMWLFVSNIPVLTGATLIGVLYGPGLVNFATMMEDNAVIHRAQFAIQENPNAKLKKKGGDPTVKTEAEKQREALELLSKKEEGKVDYMVLIVPTVILLLMSAVNGFTCMINMRIQGQFTYFFKGGLELVDRVKEYKYIAKEKVDEDEVASKPKTVKQLITDAATFVLVFDMLGLVGGLLYGNLTDTGTGKGILIGLCIGAALGMVVTAIRNAVVAFGTNAKWGAISLFTYPVGFIVYVFKNFEERKGPFFELLFSQVGGVIVLIVGLVMGAFSANTGQNSAAAGAPPAAAADMNATPMPGSSPTSSPPAAAPNPAPGANPP